MLLVPKRLPLGCRFQIADRNATTDVEKPRLMALLPERLDGSQRLCDRADTLFDAASVEMKMQPVDPQSSTASLSALAAGRDRRQQCGQAVDVKAEPRRQLGPLMFETAQS